MEALGNMIPSKIDCPLLKKEIPNTYCLEISSAVDGILKKNALEDDITQIEDYKKVCNSCKYHD